MIVDDEPLSVRVVERYLLELPHCQLVSSCTNAFDAMEALRKYPIDLLFLDINMPKLSGISLLKTLTRPPLVIFITAYPEYAVEGFELEALDYLLKPFSFERFVKAVNRATEKLDGAGAVPTPDYLFIKENKKLYKVNVSDILYLQAYGDYVKVFTNDKVFVTKERLSVLENKLPSLHFQKIHRSYYIALKAVQFIEGNQVKVGPAKLPIATTYKEELLLRLKK